MKIVDSINFISFYDKVKSQEMKIPTAYRLSKIYKAVKEDETFYQDKLRDILFKYGEVDENGNLIPVDDGKGVKIKPEGQLDCLREIEELQDTESTIQFDPLSLDILDGLNLTPSDLEGVVPFIE